MVGGGGGGGRGKCVCVCRVGDTTWIPSCLFALFFLAALPVPHIHHKNGADKSQHKHSQTELETIDQLVQESTELENGLRNLEIDLTQVSLRQIIQIISDIFY